MSRPDDDFAAAVTAAVAETEPVGARQQAVEQIIEVADEMRELLESEAFRYHKDHDHRDHGRPTGLGNCSHRSCKRVRAMRAKYDRIRAAQRVGDASPPWDHLYEADAGDRCIHCGLVGSYAHTEEFYRKWVYPSGWTFRSLQEKDT